MGTNSRIEWTDHTWNPWRGCTKVSPACDNCYMFRDAKRFGLDASTVIRANDKTFNAPLTKRWRSGDRVFVCSWSDFFHPDADKYRSEAWDVMRKRPELIFQLLTKRPERIWECLPEDWSRGWENVWLGVTAENQEQAENRIPALLVTPAARRFVSIEPMLGPVDLTRPWTIEANARYGDGHVGHLDLVIVGGESGPNARPMHPNWVRFIRNQCLAAGVSFFFKQWGEWVTENQAPEDIVLPGVSWTPKGWRGKEYEDRVWRVGKKAAGCTLDGREWKEGAE